MDPILKQIEDRIASTTTREMPYLLLSYAQSLDGSIAYKKEQTERLMLSNDASMRMTHRLRAQCDAIAIGINTALKDDPRLTVRFGQVQKQPAAIVFDSSQRLPSTAKLLSSSEKRRVIIVTKGERTELLPGRHEVLSIADGQLSTAFIALKRLAGIDSIMIEGGAHIIQASLSLADDVLLTLAPLFVPGGLRAVDSPSPAVPLRLAHQSFCTLDGDIIVYGHLPPRQPHPSVIA